MNNNNTIKTACIKAMKVDEAALNKINKLTLTPLTEEQIFTFKVKLCDNEIDRDTESFTVESLHKLAELFVGKTGIKDHNGAVDNQIARIYETEVIVEEGRTTKLGEPYTYLEAHCYILRISKNEDFIAEIEAGIKKEVSVGCCIQKRLCSVCGANLKGLYNMGCKHRPGNEYDGKVCCVRLDIPTDAYEFSFVAVPAQREAGAKKNFEVLPDEPENKKESSLNVFNSIFNNLLN